MFGYRTRVAADAEPDAGFLDAEVARQERIGVAERAHHDIAGRPFPDPWYLQQLLVRFIPVGPGIECEPAARDGARESTKCRTARRRDPEPRQVRFGDRRG